MSRRLPYVALAALFVWVGSVEVRNGIDSVDDLYLPSTTIRRPFQVVEYGNTIAKPQYEAARSGILERDQLISVEGQPYTGSAVYVAALDGKRPGDILRVEIAPEEGVPPRKAVEVRLVAGPRESLASRLVSFMIGVVTPLTCVLLGFFVAALRPRDRLAWLLLGMMTGFACIVTNSVGSWPAALRYPGLILHNFGVVVWPAFMLLFSIYFPERLEFDVKYPWVKWLFVGPLLVFGFLAALDALGASENYRAFLPLHQSLLAVSRVMYVFMMASISVFFTVLGYKHGVVRAPDARRRLSLLTRGAQVGLTPAGIVFAGRAFFNWEAPAWFAIPTLLLLFCFPATLAYVIVVHRALDVRVVIRQGLQYTLVRGGLRLLQALLVAGAIALVSRTEATQTERFAYTALAIIVVVRLREGADRVRGWIDRRFFREAVDTEKVLGELSESVRGILEPGPLMEAVARRLSESLHVARVAVLLDGKGGYCPAFALGYADAERVPCLPEQGPVARKLAEGAAARVYFDDPESWVNRLPEQRDRDSLRGLDSQLLLPLLVKDRLPGIISLGPKQSEEPYSPSDVRLLQSVAAQTGLALENARLNEAVASEMAQRERLNREIEIAREVQERLFPQNSPALAGFDYCGHCRPALGVGGDYYDFIPQNDGTLGIAIGDVSGKGIAAALLMASLQASLRGQTLREGEERGAKLATIMRHVNKLVYDASSSNRYATFFFAVFDPRTRHLTYVNAGHNPPAVIRGGETIRLEDGGAVVGLLPNFPYGEGELQLQPGDVFIGYTDGISEAMNPEDEEWGEDAMIEAARACRGLVARAMIDRLMAEADAFARGAKQHDDMTLVVGRVL